VLVVWGGGGIRGPFTKEDGPSPSLEGPVGRCHDLGWRYVCSLRREGVENQGES